MIMISVFSSLFIFIWYAWFWNKYKLKIEIEIAWKEWKAKTKLLN